jgi:glycosyltransferase involved in cell wall biosynthesis
MVRHLARKGIEVTLYTSPADGEVKGLDGVRIRFVPYRVFPWPRRSGFVIADRSTNYLAWSVRAARRMMAEPADPTDIVQAEGAAGFGYALLRRSDGPPMVVHPVGMEEFKAAGLKRAGYFPLRTGARYAARRAERVIVPDRVMMEEVRQYLSIESTQAVVLPTPIDLEEVDRPAPPETEEAILQRLALGASGAVLLSVGRLESYKGFSVLIEALGRVKDKLPDDWVWVLVGRGPEESRLREQLQRSRLSDRTRLVGRVSDEELSALYERAELFVHPTLYEGSSLVTLEAMAHAKPVVATTAGGIPDKVEEGKSGFLVPPGDAEALGAALVRAFSLGSELALLGREGRLRVESDFSWSERIGSLVDVYREVLSERR